MTVLIQITNYGLKTVYIGMGKQQCKIHTGEMVSYHIKGYMTEKKYKKRKKKS